MTPEERAEKELAEELGFDIFLGDNGLTAKKKGVSIQQCDSDFFLLWSLALRQRVELDALNKRTAEGAPTDGKET